MKGYVQRSPPPLSRKMSKLGTSQVEENSIASIDKDKNQCKMIKINQGPKQLSLALSKSNPSIFTNNYIKVQNFDCNRQKNKQESLKIYQALIPEIIPRNKQEIKKKSLIISKDSSPSRGFKDRQIGSPSDKTKTQDEAQKRSPKFTRKSFLFPSDVVQSVRVSPSMKSATSDISLLKPDKTKGNSKLQKNQNDSKTITELKQLISCKDTLIQQLQLKIRTINIKLNKEKQQQQKIIKRLEQSIKHSQQEKAELAKRIEQFIGESQMLRTSSSEIFGMYDDKKTGAQAYDQIETSAGLAENLSDIEIELHKKSQQNHQLRRSIEQLKTKMHCQNLRHIQIMKDCQKYWNKKFQKFKQYVCFHQKNDKNLEMSPSSKKKSCKNPEEITSRQNLGNKRPSHTIIHPSKLQCRNSILSDKDSIISLSISFESSSQLQ